MMLSHLDALSLKTGDFTSTRLAIWGNEEDIAIREKPVWGLKTSEAQNQKQFKK
jgi:hypothetical protein